MGFSYGGPGTDRKLQGKRIFLCFVQNGNGNYKVTVYENVDGSKYATMLSVSFQVALSRELAEEASGTLKKVEKIIIGKNGPTSFRHA